MVVAVVHGDRIPGGVKVCSSVLGSQYPLRVHLSVLPDCVALGMESSG